MNWSIFFGCFAALWAMCSIAAIPLAVKLYNRDARDTYTEKIDGTFIFWSTIALAPIFLGEAFARNVEDD